MHVHKHCVLFWCLLLPASIVVFVLCPSIDSTRCSDPLISTVRLGMARTTQGSPMGASTGSQSFDRSIVGICQARQLPDLWPAPTKPSALAVSAQHRPKLTFKHVDSDPLLWTHSPSVAVCSSLMRDMGCQYEFVYVKGIWQWVVLSSVSVPCKLITDSVVEFQKLTMSSEPTFGWSATLTSSLAFALSSSPTFLI